MLLSAIVSRGVFEKPSAVTSPSSRTAVRSCCKPGVRSSTPPGRPLNQKYAVPSSKQPAQTAGEDAIVGGDSFIARLGRKLVVTALVVYKGGISPLFPSFLQVLSNLLGICHGGSRAARSKPGPMAGRQASAALPAVCSRWPRCGSRCLKRTTSNLFRKGCCWPACCQRWRLRRMSTPRI